MRVKWDVRRGLELATCRTRISQKRLADSAIARLQERDAPLMALDRITIRGARQHNLKDISLEIPRNRLTVVTGLSGSGKSSLAFDTIYAEGQRRYVESLSAYARQFLDQLEKPDVDGIEGLSPAISIEQRTTTRSPRSTVGTVTEIYDYLRLLFSSIGQPHCPKCGRPISRQSIDQILQQLSTLREGERVMILAPIVRGRKGEFKKEIEKLARSGFTRARIDGELRQLDEEIKLDKRRNHSIDVVVDRLLVKHGVQKRLEESVQLASKLTDGLVVVSVVDGEERLYSEKMACPECGISVPALEPRSFSFNSVYGACSACHGIGTRSEIDPARVVPDPGLPIKEQDPFPADAAISTYLVDVMKSLARTVGLPPDTPFGQLPQKTQETFFFGSKEKLSLKYGAYEYKAEWKGAINYLNRRAQESRSEAAVAAFEGLISQALCPECKGQRLQPASLAVRVAGHTISEFTGLPISEAVGEFAKIKLNAREEKIAGLILREIKQRVSFLATVGLGYLTLDRGSSTLSGGESQRIRLATQIGSQLRGVLYVLDEPSIGLHPRDNLKLLDTLERLRDLGNTVLIVEHDEETIRRADHVVDLGPGAGAHGGHIVAEGSPETIAASAESLTGKYISGRS